MNSVVKMNARQLMNGCAVRKNPIEGMKEAPIR
jgi:hypothetical protein